MTDPELMALASAGDESAFAALVDKYRNAVLNFFCRKNVPHSDAQDLAQRTFIRIWRYRSRYSPKAKFTTFLFMLAHQEAIDFFRSESRRREAMDDVARDTAPVVAASAGKMTGADDSVWKAFRELPEAMRSVVELVVLQDLPQAEAAEVLGVPLGTVKSRLFNALRKLKGTLAASAHAFLR